MAYMKDPSDEEDDEAPKATTDTKEDKEDKVPTEEDLQKGLSMLEVYKQQMEAYAREAERIGASLTDHARALDTLNALKNMKQPTEMIIPIGAGVFIHVKPTTTSKTVMKIGAGISAEYEVEATYGKVEEAIKEMEEREKKVITELQKVERTAEALSQQLQASYEQMQKARQ